MRIINRQGNIEYLDIEKIFERITKATEYCIGSVDDGRGHYSFESLDLDVLSLKVVSNIRDNITTSELDEITSRICMNMSLESPEWGILGSRICISNHQKNTKWSFSEAMEMLYNNKNDKGEHCPLVSENLYITVFRYKDTLEKQILDPERDFLLDFFGFKTLERSYLLRTSDGIIRETPQYMFLRVAIGIWGDNMEKVQETYDMLSNKLATHATPTLFNSGTPKPQFASCFLLGTEDSIDGIYKMISDCARISKWAGGIGVHISNVRSKGSYIKGTGGKTDGIIPMMKVLNSTARYVNQSGKRCGSIAVYIEPWHADIIDFLKAMRNHGDEETLARDLFYSLWIPDLFMTAVVKDEDWYLMCPDECSGLTDAFGEHFVELYKEYFNKGMYKRKVKAREIWDEIVKSQIESGMPYMCYKDNVNYKNNQKNIGTIKSSNLCSEVLIYSDEKQYGTCFLSSICLPKHLHYSKPEIFGENEFIESITVYTTDGCEWCSLFNVFMEEMKKDIKQYNKVDPSVCFLKVSGEDKESFFKGLLKDAENHNTYSEKCGLGKRTFPYIIVNTNETHYQTVDNKKYYYNFRRFIQDFGLKIDYKKLESTVRTLVRNLDHIIDINYYPCIESERSSKSLRPIGIGVQGFADMLSMMWIPYESEEAFDVNCELFSKIYLFALKESAELAKEKGTYEYYEGSPMSSGIFQHHMWNDKLAQKNFGLKIKVSEIIQNKGFEKYFDNEIKPRVKVYGLRNSLLTSLMPTASTSQIMGNSEMFEPHTSNMFLRRTLSGEFIVINKQLITILKHLGLWNNEMRQRIMFHRGSIQSIKDIPEYIRDIFKTVWEVKKKTLIDMAVARGRFIDQSQSFNIYIDKPSPDIITKTQLYAWRGGMKTGAYYTRSKPATNAQSFTIDPNLENKFIKEQMEIEEYNDNKTCSSCGA